ncbi:hypothetical protein TL08_05190 [Actinoalloteichus hymeniacidonis]|uniref:Uncharacterized protein n=1 Tax=Actinoalloteichus hymeniacidonis TaxID=340345 RepID=A0AAC9HN38_9PSEU|nr:hypothetical protein TL08_05190 [Actinoalloteichus hymeniacidonis]
MKERRAGRSSSSPPLTPAGPERTARNPHRGACGGRPRNIVAKRTRRVLATSTRHSCVKLGDRTTDPSFGSEHYVGQAGDLVEVVGSWAEDQFVGAQGLELLDGVAQ